MRIGTRGSALALAQASTVAEALGGELVPIVTSGDRARALGDKERWVKEIDRALLEGEVDVAVHSAKDVPGELAEGIAIAATPPRADPRDALCGAASLDALPEGARVGTASLRREAQLRAARPDLDVRELRGNVDTRLAKLAASELDAIVLAAAGLQRLGRAWDGLLEHTPAAGQGVLAVCTRVGDEALAAPVDDEATHRALRAERALVVALDADCHTPMAAHAEKRGRALLLTAFVGRPDGSAWLRDELEGDDPEVLGAEVAARLRAAGADEVLGR